MKAIKIPFQFSGGRVNTTTSATTIAEQKIVDVLTTSNFERVMNHQYGAGINNLLFEPIDELVVLDFKTDAIAEIRSNVSRVNVMDIRMSPSNSVAAYGSPETTMGVTVVYRLPLGSAQIVKFNVAIPGDLNEDSII
jgi:phage baseplate assembly protein W